jgi:hypothetical protein
MTFSSFRCRLAKFGMGEEQVTKNVTGFADVCPFDRPGAAV